MSHPEGARPDASIVRSPRFWLAPIAVVTLLMSLLAALYMGSILDPKSHLRGFPIALVDQDVGDVVDGPDGPVHQNFGHDIAAGLVANIPSDKVDLQQISWAEASSRLDTGDLYGAIVIPSDFTKRTAILAQASVVPGDVERPVITAYTNPRAGSFGVGITQSITGSALAAANETMGKQLSATVTERLAAVAPDATVSGGAAIVLANPIDILALPHNPLPDGTGNGLSAFYFALLLVLAGFTGATVVNTVVDGMLGFAPTEYGPWFVHRDSVGISRFHTLLIKWAIMAILAAVVSALYIWISSALGMPVPNALELWEFGAFVIAAIGITAVSVMAAFGTAGLLVNLLVFVVLALPSSGGAVPIEATPPIYGFLAQFEPMHQVFLGTRAILYFNGSADAGLLHAVSMTSIGLLIGLVIGIVATRFYDRRGLHRVRRTPPSAPAEV
ncbi:DUF3533 domain-containing protein [Rhodococcus sp. ABRD24]|uniref:YhgE/Pip domain-containing protein n=1 Tax=Rhodococcus sp. ABRD24 TaxID=2507582 RepID=UPI00103BBCB6|nr:DUF3533 domain-containing protein [Rhodococcus sp. ABRD24]QBJ98618.1 DUF3533 domain-containing protein [Rhodococcus sp. ABRD24]